MAQIYCSNCGRSHNHRLPFTISRNLILIETIFLQFNEIDIESIYTLSYILKLYPLLLELKSVRNHYSYIQKCLRGYGDIETVELLYKTVLRESNPFGRDGPDMSLQEYPLIESEFYKSNKYWVFQVRKPAYNINQYPILQSLMKCGSILYSKLKLRRGIIENGELEISAYFCCHLGTGHFKMSQIKSGRFHIRNRNEVRDTLWKAISILFENILNYEHLMWCHLYTVKMATISI